MFRKNSQILNGAIFCLIFFAFSLSGCRTTANVAENSPERKAAEGSAPIANVIQNNVNSSAVNSNQSNQNAVAVNSPQTIDKSDREQTIDRYINGVAKVSKASEYKEARKIVYGDLDGDGDEDAVAQFTIEGIGGGNNYGFYLAAFKNDNGKFTGVTDEVVGGKLNREVELNRIESGKILLDTKGYDDDDGACCPSVEGKTSYILQGNKLVERKMK